VAFSPDGTRLASASDDNTVKLWDAASGKGLHTLKGHTNFVWSVAFSPDGTKLASGSWDHAVKLWDSVSGQELRTLTGHNAEVTNVAFSPDGTRLASGDGNTVKLWDTANGQELRTLRVGHVFWHLGFSPDGTRLVAAGDTITIWDAAPSTPKVLAEREALGLVKFLFTKPLLKPQVIEALRCSKMINEAVRQRALALVEGYWKSTVRRQANSLVNRLRTKLMINLDVIETIRTDVTLSEELRAEALSLAEDKWVDLRPIYRACWEIVCEPGAPPTAYRRALRLAEEICRFDDGEQFPKILGMAQYRVGHYQKALETLSRLNVSERNHPRVLAFQVMALHHLGQTGKAQEYLTYLRKTLKEPIWAKNDVHPTPQTIGMLSFLREAEALLQEQTEKPAR
jgi:hypothetical protein